MEKHYLVQRGELESILTTLIEKQKTVIEDIDKCLPLMQDAELIKRLSTQKTRAEAQLKALEEGYVPIVGGWFWNIDTTNRWAKSQVKAVMETMPEEVKAVMEEAKESGVFDQIKVSGARRGDPMLVGTTGHRNFLLAMWANLEGGYSVGIRVGSKHYNSKPARIE